MIISMIDSELCGLGRKLDNDGLKTSCINTTFKEFLIIRHFIISTLLAMNQIV